MTTEFAERLAAIHRARGQTQQELADAVGVLSVSSDALLFDSDERGPDEELR